MNGSAFDFEERQIIEAQVDAGRKPAAVLASVNEFRARNGRPPHAYKIVADRVARLRSEPDTGNIYGHVLGYGPGVTAGQEREATRRMQYHPELTGRLLGDPHPCIASRPKPPAPRTRDKRDPLDFSDLEPEAEYIALRAFELYAPESV